MTPPIAVTMGDPCGIGPEICARLFADGVRAPAFVIGDAGAMRRAAAALGLRLAVHEIASPREASARPGQVDVLAASRLPDDLPVGRIDARAGRAAYDYVVRAIDLANAGEVRAIVTAPIAKEALKAAGIAYPGHTEILGERTGTSDFAMMLANGELRTVLVTIHVSLAEAIGLVTRDRVLRTIRLAHRACRAYGIDAPRVAVAGLNPHAGEAGMFGREDLDEIAPAIDDARREGIDASGPWPGDTVFMRARRGDFDIVVAQYHDQGLIPVKYGGIDHGVNVTIGLPFVRTSVDHGTAFDIAGTGKADASSLRHAFEQALLLLDDARGEEDVTAPPDFIFMLTRNDRTVPDAAERLKDAVAAGVGHIGFKDVGLPLEDLEALAAAIRASGAKVYLETVSLDADSERRSAEAAVKLRVDVLMGGTRPEVVLPVIAGTGIRYYPFAGAVAGHPSVLTGTVETIAESAARLAGMAGVHGLDLLAYRFEGDVPRLIEEVRRAAAPKPVIVAGSIDRRERVEAAAAAGATAFTVGTAALDGAFAARSGALPDQLAAIREAALPPAIQKAALPPGKVNLAASFGKLDAFWSPQTVGSVNGVQVKLAKFEGCFHWHRHEREDEMFLVVAGRLRMGFRDRHVDLDPGEFIVVPRGVEHRPEALTQECHVVLVEPGTTVKAGDGPLGQERGAA
ncbi:4-hydroxythreonine-4-phosphate dehydrogenase PdxA [Arenibaculum sp.]|uniref:4-hydroxythreonine-4-phosphate dehydrogenase PdxA n=1 Tax=Arenibaculum sp. TaxID=2865862 RepID=UPI002E0DB43A|nr:4-hydroxythreonine-4-phosphate dehydrogenase PdxA [Arenibaculum sp.]